jgi:phosphate transport system substrate-binding protein
MVMHNKAIAGSAKQVAEGPDVAEAVSKDPGAIGFVSFSQIGQSRALAIRDGNSSAMTPTSFGIATEDYPISRRLFLYLPPKTTRPHAASFAAFAVSDEGQDVVDSSGFVSLRVRAETISASKDWPKEYGSQVGSAQRLAVDFRFESGSATLDAKARADLARVAGFLKGSSHRELLLFGFTDDKGNQSDNLALSKERAKAIATELQARGATIALVDGFGSALPVAANDTDGGRQRNRRVEAWVR